MRKKTIRLTESRFRELIQETIEEALNEMDWRTYASAGEKAANLQQRKRANRFGNAAEKAFDRDYGYNDSDSEYKSYDFDPEYIEYSSVSGIEPADNERLNVGTNNAFKKIHYHDTFGDEYSPLYGSNDQYFDLEPDDNPNTIKATYIEPSQFHNKANKGLKKAMQRGNRALDDYASGRTTYRSRNKGGKGWANYDED